ncbi:MAG: DUF3489 domain-containing protein [Alsobacter sp.]
MPRKTPSTLTPTLTDTQLVLLSAAAQRQDRVLEQGETMTARAFTRALNGLLKAGLVEALQSRDDEPSAEIYAATSAGLAAIGIEAEPTPSSDETVDWIVDGQMVLTPPSEDTLRQNPTTKRALIIAMLGREEGATIAELMAATGWLAHTTRAALTGLRHKGHRVERSRLDEGPSIYRIVTDAPERAA